MLVAYIEHDPQPVAVAGLVRDGHSADIAFAFSDEHQLRGIGFALAAELIADARAAGITEIAALVSSDNPVAVAVRRCIANVLEIRRDGPELTVHVAIA